MEGESGSFLDHGRGLAAAKGIGSFGVTDADHGEGGQALSKLSTIAGGL